METKSINRHGSYINAYKYHSKPLVNACQFKVIQGNKVKKAKLKISGSCGVICFKFRFLLRMPKMTLGYFLNCLNASKK